MWYLVDQEEQAGEETVRVKVRRLKGGKSRSKENGRMVVKPFRIPNLMFKALIDSDTNKTAWMLPREIVFSQMWVNKKDGTKFQAGTVKTKCPKTGNVVEVKSRPDTRFYYLRNKVTVKAVQMRYYKEERTSKRCTSKVTKRVPVDELTNGAIRDENGEWYIKHVIGQRDFEVNDAEYNDRWDTLAKYLVSEFGYDVAREYLTELLGRINEHTT
jgi:hypothetical protein